MTMKLWVNDHGYACGFVCQWRSKRGPCSGKGEFRITDGERVRGVCEAHKDLAFKQGWGWYQWSGE